VYGLISSPVRVVTVRRSGAVTPFVVAVHRAERSGASPGSALVCAQLRLAVAPGKRAG
jgi:hypothetical protein